VGAAACEGGNLRAGVAAFLDEAATALRSATRKSIEMRRVTHDLSISFDRRRPVGNSAGNGPARRHADHDMARARRRAPIAKGGTVKAKFSGLHVTGCDLLTGTTRTCSSTTSPRPSRWGGGSHGRERVVEDLNCVSPSCRVEHEARSIAPVRNLDPELVLELSAIPEQVDDDSFALAVSEVISRG